MKVCNALGCGNPVFAKRFCGFHQYLRADFQQKLAARPRAVASRQTFRAFTPKRQQDNKAYYLRARLFRAANPLCQIKAPGCTREAQGIHHVRGKDTVQDLMNEKEWKAACNWCNGYLESHDAWAREHGFKKSKHHAN